MTQLLSGGPRPKSQVITSGWSYVFLVDQLSNIFLELDQNWLYITDLHLVWHLLQINFKLAGWHENPIKSVVLTFPIDKIVFPTVTLCPRDSRPDRWGSVIKIFDQLDTNCGSIRWDSIFNSKANDLILNSLNQEKEKKKTSPPFLSNTIEMTFIWMSTVGRS